MARHSSRSSYFVANEGMFNESPATGGCPHSMNTTAETASKPVLFKFGRMFDARPEITRCLTELGTKMGRTASEDSSIPSGYTYLSQFIAHEITFDKTKGMPETDATPDNLRSPQIDLDSLYGNDEDPHRGRFYETENPALLKIGKTFPEEMVGGLYNDLCRDSETGEALIPDERNDENLAVAQVHVAFMKFHNAIVNALQESTPADKLFETARAEVVKHFQWIVLYDYLDTILDKDVLKNVLAEGPKFFTPQKADLFMPLEFSAAAFRLGHSMVRKSYDWNYLLSSNLNNLVDVKFLFTETHFSGRIGRVNDVPPRLRSRWIIDWRRFFDFSVIKQGEKPIYPHPGAFNYARRIDTAVEMGLENQATFDHGPFTGAQQSIAVRNLLRGSGLRLLTGEEVAELIGVTALSGADIVKGYEDCFNSRWLNGRTPLWFYVLREAEVCHRGNRLGPVGSRILAETFVTLIKHSNYSIFNEPTWRPRMDASREEEGERIFKMVDLLHFADVVNPIRL